jgi:hypothetical protein
VYVSVCVCVVCVLHIANILSTATRGHTSYVTKLSAKTHGCIHNDTKVLAQKNNVKVILK